MPPRHVYWTIIAGGLPTAFRAAEKDDLLPTFRQIQQTQPDAQMKFFARGKLWDSPEQALRAEDSETRSGERRGRDWRPGGEHRDPRQRFRDAKKAKNQFRRGQRWERKHQTPGGSAEKRSNAPREKPQGDPLRHDVVTRRPARQGGRKPASDRGPGPDWRNRPRGQENRREGDRGRGKEAWRDRGARTGAHGPKGQRPFKPRSGGRPPARGQTSEPPPPPRPPGPNRPPRPGHEPPPEPPPRPSEPVIAPPPPERGRRSDSDS